MYPCLGVSYQGFTVVYEDSIYIIFRYDSGDNQSFPHPTIRHVQCELITERHLTGRCLQCQEYRLDFIGSAGMYTEWGGGGGGGGALGSPPSLTPPPPPRNQ